MDDFNYNNKSGDSPYQQGGGYHQPSQWQQEQPSTAQQGEEPRTPYQTPVQHPEYRSAPYGQQPYGSGQMPGGAPHTPPQPPKKRGHGAVIALCSVAAACLLFAGGAVLGYFVTGADGQPGDTQADAGKSGLPTVQITERPVYDPDNYDVVNGLAGEEIYKKVSPSIVSVVSNAGSGSGVIMSEDGYIITNNHVVEDAQQVAVMLSDGTQLPAEIVGLDEQTDLAVLRATTITKLTAAEFGDSDQLQPGEYAYAIGSPGGVELANTITGGRISAINRDITISDRVMSLIQTDASINPGNSGGALINKYGQVVGITSAKISGSSFGSAAYEGLGFAIPMNTAKTIVDELIANGYIAGRPSIGITGQNIDQGVYIRWIDPRAYAASEGLKAGDIITAVNGQQVSTMNEINAIKEGMKAGDKITLTVYRMSEGRTIDVTVTLTDAHDLSSENGSTEQQQTPQNGSGGYYYNDPFSYFFRW